MDIVEEEAGCFGEAGDEGVEDREDVDPDEEWRQVRVLAGESGGGSGGWRGVAEDVEVGPETGYEEEQGEERCPVVPPPGDALNAPAEEAEGDEDYGEDEARDEGRDEVRRSSVGGRKRWTSRSGSGRCAGHPDSADRRLRSCTYKEDTYKRFGRCFALEHHYSPKLIHI